MAHRSFLTQRIANRLPDWTDGRLLPHSLLQQWVNPTASEIEDLYKYLITETRCSFLTAGNLDTMDVVNVIRLPNDFVFGRYLNHLHNEAYVVPYICGYINGRDIWPTVVNNVDDFWNDALPTRITATGRQRYAGSVVDETLLNALEAVTPNSITHPTRLAVIVSGCADFTDVTRRIPISYLVLSGTTERDLEETEVIRIPYNGTFLTNKIWKVLDKVEYYGLQPEDVGTVQVNNFAFNIEREVDKYQLFITPDYEKLLYHKLGTYTFEEGDFSTHQHVTMVGSSVGELSAGHDSLEVVREIELLYNGSNIQLVDIAVQPFTGRIFGLSSQYLYIFDPYTSMPTFKNMQDKDPGSSLVVESDKYDFVRGETASVTVTWRRQLKRILKNRWSVCKPDGTIIYLNILGEEVSATAAWQANSLYTELAFGPFETDDGKIDKQVINYLLTERGTYQFIVETVFVDSSTEKDILPLHVHSKEAVARLILPIQLQDGEGLAFDADQKLWILRAVGGSNPYDVPSEYGIEYDIYGVAMEASLATDTAMVDFRNKIVYLHEVYDSVDITETDDWLVER